MKIADPVPRVGIEEVVVSFLRLLEIRAVLEPDGAGDDAQ